MFYAICCRQAVYLLLYAIYYPQYTVCKVQYAFLMCNILNFTGRTPDTNTQLWLLNQASPVKNQLPGLPKSFCGGVGQPILSPLCQ